MSSDIIFIISKIITSKLKCSGLLANINGNDQAAKDAIVLFIQPSLLSILIKELMTSVTLHQPWLSHSTKLHKIKQNNNHIGPFPSSYPESLKCLGNYQKILNWIHKTYTQLLNGKRG